MKSYNEWLNENVEVVAVNQSLNHVFRSIQNIKDPRLKEEILHAFNQFQVTLSTLMDKYAQR